MGQSLRVTRLNSSNALDYMLLAALILSLSGHQNFECFALLAPMASSSTMLSHFLYFGYIIRVVPSFRGAVLHKNLDLQDQLHEYAISLW